MMRKYLTYLLVGLACFVAGMAVEKVTRGAVNVPPCPDCPDALLQVQTLDLEQVKKIRGDFTFSPTYSGTIYLCDTLTRP
jgi:hypothetical protein